MPPYAPIIVSQATNAMKTIYVLTEGSYSDYHIVGVYSTKELAEEAQSLHDCAEIEEYQLDNIPKYPPGMVAWHVRITRGEIWFGDSWQTNPFDDKVPSEEEYSYADGSSHYVVKCWATDKEHAEKIALDKYYQHQAEKAGIA